LKSSPHTTTRAETSARPCQRGSGGRACVAKQRGPSPRGGAEERSGPARTWRRWRRRRGQRRRGEVADAMARGVRSSLRMPRWRRGQAPWQGGAKGRSRQALRPCLSWIWPRGARQRKPPEGQVVPAARVHTAASSYVRCLCLRVRAEPPGRRPPPPCSVHSKTRSDASRQGKARQRVQQTYSHRWSMIPQLYCLPVFPSSPQALITLR
jgi:hypothetical protein